VQVETWENFDQEVRQFVSNKVSEIETEPQESQEFASNIKIFNRTKLTYSSEKNVEDALKQFFITVVQTSIRLIFGKDIGLSHVGDARLDPDLAFVLCRDNIDSTLALVEVKTPKAFPLGPDLVECFRTEQAKLKPNADIIEKLRRSGKDQVLINPDETKASRAITQLWGYLSVNNLKYGILTTFNDTYFFKREFSEGQGVSRLEISKSVSIGDSSVPIVGALCYFSGLLLESHLYAPPYSTLILRLKSAPNVNKYKVTHVDISDFRFGVATDFQTGANVILGEYSPNKTAIFQMLDSTKPRATTMFFTELEAYRRLDGLQGTVVPNLHYSYLMSAFLFSLILQHCGQPISQTQFREFYEHILNAVKAVHQRGVLHGDIALRNILIDSTSNKVVLVDFGVASFLGTPADNEYGLSFISDEIEWEARCENEIFELQNLL
jgi:hypothetical protein